MILAAHLRGMRDDARYRRRVLRSLRMNAQYITSLRYHEERKNVAKWKGRTFVWVK